MKLVVLILTLLAVKSFAWHSCGEGSGICPDGNACCSSNSSTGTGNVSTSTCISGKEESMGSCCTDDAEGSTGCGDGFECARHSYTSHSHERPTRRANQDYDSEYDYDSYYCQKSDPEDDTLPDRVPRYKLCSLPDPVLKQVHGLSVTTNLNDPQLAYLSTMGAIDSGDPQTLNRHAKVQTLMVMVHGSSRNVDDYICCSNSALPTQEQDPATSSIMIVAPWFLAPSDMPVNITSTGNPNAAALVWADKARMDEVDPVYHTWRYGADAINAGISSYATVDAIVNRVLEDRVRFPSLKRIVVAGHSAGGQFTQRWALLSNSKAFADPSQGYIPRAPTRTVVANPKSFCWLDARRYVNGTLRVPDDDDINDCPWYNEWEWGLGEGDYLKTPYKDIAIELAGGTDEVVRRYPTRDIVYIAGELDILPNGQCMATAQGPYRRARSANFFSSLKDIYGRSVHHRLVVSGVNHDHCLMFQSPEGQQALFGLHGENQMISEDDEMI